jgi:hypothetical protein
MRTYIYGGLWILLCIAFIISLVILDPDPLNKTGLGILFSSIVGFLALVAIGFLDLIIYGTRSLIRRVKIHKMLAGNT